VLGSLAINLKFWLERVMVLLHHKRAAFGRESTLPGRSTANDGRLYRTPHDGTAIQASPEVRWQPRQIDPARLEAHLKLLDVGLKPSSSN